MQLEPVWSEDFPYRQAMATAWIAYMWGHCPDHYLCKLKGGKFITV